eukprot:3202419-Rhodomonas_salina.1
MGTDSRAALQSVIRRIIQAFERKLASQLGIGDLLCGRSPSSRFLFADFRFCLWLVWAHVIASALYPGTRVLGYTCVLCSRTGSCAEPVFECQIRVHCSVLARSPSNQKKILAPAINI